MGWMAGRSMLYLPEDVHHEDDSHNHQGDHDSCAETRLVSRLAFFTRTTSEAFDHLLRDESGVVEATTRAETESGTRPGAALGTFYQQAYVWSLLGD